MELLKYQRPEPCKPQHVPYQWGKNQYGQTTQYVKPADNSPKLDADGIKQIQKIIGTLLYYARSVESTMLMAINAISAVQVNGTNSTAADVAWLLDYAAISPDATVLYEAIKIILRIHSDASYQSETEYRSRAGGHFSLGSPNYNDTK